MSHEQTAEIQNRILSLKAELDALSVKLMAIQTPAAADEVAAAPELSETTTMTVANGVKERRAISLDSTRTLRDLLWQGRWSLAYHLAKALEAQDASTEFASTTIRAWTLAVTAERRSGFEASALIQELCRPASNEESLAERTLKWAAIIGLLRAIDPGEVRACASLFTPPADLAATAVWWDEYVSALASAARPAARWLSLPEQEPVTEEINQLMIVSENEPVRLAASCLMMSVKTAMRRVHMASAADPRFILNSELARGTSVAFDEKGEVSSSASDVERAICELAAGSNSPAQALVTEAPKTVKDEPVIADLLIEAPTPRAQMALERLEAVEESLHSAVNEHREPAASEALRESRREEARQRLKRYSERVAARTASRATIPMTPQRTGSEAARPAVGRPFISISEAEPSVHAITTRVAASTMAMEPALPVDSPASNGAEESRPEPSMEDRRGIHETAVAYAFADPARSGKGAAPASVRPYNDASIWSSLVTPQAAIIGGLMVIASAILAGLGNGLSASSISTNPAESTPAENSTADAGDFQVVQ